MAAAIVLLSGMVSNRGRSWLVSLLAGWGHFATDGIPVARDSGLNPTTTIPEGRAQNAPQSGLSRFYN